MKRLTVLFLILLLVLSACGPQNKNSGNVPGNNTAPRNDAAPASYKQITQEQAKEMMARDDGHIIVDVRRQDEYDDGHIPGAVLIPNETIGSERPAQLPDLEQIILVYCRSGRRSKEASQKLADMGYVNVYEFGGIIDWTGETVKTGEENQEGAMRLKIGGTEVPVRWEDNASVKALEELAPLSVQMSMYGGFEQVGPLGSSLPRSDAGTTTQPGDIVLYSGNQIVIFYGSNSWSYTMLGHIDLPAQKLAELLSNGNVVIELVK